MSDGDERPRTRPDAPSPARAAAAAAAPNRSAEQDPWFGRIVGGRFQICEPLGQGGMAVVYRAQEQGFIRRDVAIKLLHPEAALSHSTLSRFLKEAQLIADIRHPNVVHVIDVGRTDDGNLYLVMELLVGRTLHHELRDLVRSGQVFPWERAAGIGLQICAALKAAHKAKVVHRDIKPSNCFLIEVDGSQDFIKLLDFGIAKAQVAESPEASLATPLTQEGMFLGTPHYAAPEVITQRADWAIDGRADIFAVGVLLYQLVTGSLPFQGESKLDVLFKTVRERVEPPRQRAPQFDIPPEAEAVIMKATEISPNDRFQTVSEMADAIRATLHPSLQMALRPTTLPTLTGTHALGRREPPQPVTAREPAPPETEAGFQTHEPSQVDVDLAGMSHVDDTPLPGEPSLAAHVHPSTLAEPSLAVAPQPPQKVSRGTLALLSAMLVGLVALLGLLVHELTGAPSPPPATASASRPAPVQAPVPVAPPPRKPEPQPQPQPQPVEPPGATAAGPEPSEPADPPFDLQAGRKQQIRERMKALARGDAVLRCLPDTVLLGDGVTDPLPLVVTVDTGGRTRATVQERGAKRRIPASADACVLGLIAGQRFPPADAAVTVPVTLNID